MTTIADLKHSIRVQRLRVTDDFYGQRKEVIEDYVLHCQILDKGVTETDGNGHVHEIRELLFTVRSSPKTLAIVPDEYQIIYKDQIYDINHVEWDTGSLRWLKIHGRRKTHAG